MSQNKLILLLMSIAYLLLTLFLFLSNSGIEVLLLFSIFTYIFYTPLTAVFKYDIDDIDQYEISNYIQKIALTLVAVLIIYLSGFFSAETLVKILKFIVDGIPEFKVPDIMSFLKTLGPLELLMFLGVAFILRIYILALIAFFIALWLLLFILNILFGLVIILAYFLISVAFLVFLFFIAYKGQKLSSKYIDSDFQRAIIFFSTITSALYMVGVFYINLFTLG